MLELDGDAVAIEAIDLWKGTKENRQRGNGMNIQRGGDHYHIFEFTTKLAEGSDKTRYNTNGLVEMGRLFVAEVLALSQNRRRT